jgi:heme o synthase
MNISNGCKKNSVIEVLRGIFAGVGSSVFSRLIPWLQLTKLPLCLLVAFASLLGSVMAGPVQMVRSLTISLGMLFIACGCAALNSLQEISLDASMARTNKRPLPQGRISWRGAGGSALLLFIAGFSVMYGGAESLLSLGLALLAVVLYGGIYTYLKKKTVAAIIPGAISGALPVYIGWTAGGGDPLSSTAFFLILLFILWQVPHSLLILLRYKDEYLAHTLPSLVKILPEPSLRRICMVWTGAFNAGVLFFSVTPAGLTDTARFLLHICVWALFVALWAQMHRERKPDYQYLYIQLNLYLFFAILILTGDRLLLS